MGEDIIASILLVENEYQQAIESAQNKAQLLISERRKMQAEHLEQMRLEWEKFEQEQALQLTQMLSEQEKRMDEEAFELRGRLRKKQQEVAEIISERLKQEVLSAHGDC